MPALRNKILYQGKHLFHNDLNYHFVFFHHFQKVNNLTHIEYLPKKQKYVQEILLKKEDLGLKPDHDR